MLKKIFIVIKRLTIALCTLYTFNLIISKTGMIVPINIPSIAIVSLLGLPSIIGLFVLKLII